TVAELDDVAILHDVVLPLDADAAAGPRLGHRPGVDEVGERHDLGLDEAPLEVGVDDAGRLGRLPALPDRPGARLLRARREEGLQPEGVEADPRQLVESALRLPRAREQ